MPAPSSSSRLFVAALPSGLLHAAAVTGIILYAQAAWRTRLESWELLIIASGVGGLGYGCGLVASAIRQPLRSAVVGGLLAGILYLPFILIGYACVWLTNELDARLVHLGTFAIICSGALGGGWGAYFCQGSNPSATSVEPISPRTETAIQSRNAFSE